MASEHAGIPSLVAFYALADLKISIFANWSRLVSKNLGAK